MGLRTLSVEVQVHSKARRAAAHLPGREEAVLLTGVRPGCAEKAQDVTLNSPFNISFS